MIKLGITGGIGSGKSTVAKIFSLLGVPVYDADSQAKKLMNEDPELHYKLSEQFGAQAYENGGLNKKWLAEQVFNNPEKLEKLNQIVHPIVIQHSLNWMNRQTSPLIAKEAAIIFESGSAAGLDYIVGVFAPEHIRIQRVMQRDGLTSQQVKERIARQLNENVKMKLCDFVLVNNEQQLLIPQVVRLISLLKQGTMPDKSIQ